MRLIFILNCLILFHPLQAYVKSLEGVPIELTFLLQTAQDYPLSKEESNNLEKSIQLLDTNLQYLTQREMTFLLKSEIYKGILHFPISKDNIVLADAEKLIKGLAEKQNTTLNPFHGWLIESFKQDLIILSSDKKFSKILENKKSKTSANNLEERILAKKLQLVMSWANFLVNSSEEEMSTTLKPLLLKMITTLNVRTELFAKLTKFNFSSKNVLPLKYFSIQDKKEVLPPAIEEMRKVENLVLPQEVEVIPEVKWKPAEDGPKLRAPSPDPNYRPPLELPKAKNGWDN